MSHPAPDIDFLDAEKVLFEEIEFDGAKLRYDTHRQNGERVEQLFELLAARNAIPEHRVHWFTDAQFNPGGRGRSRQDRWSQNGTSGREVFYHPSFLSYFQYFVCGPRLPAGLILAFRQAVEDCGMVTSGDIPVLTKTARALARQYGAREPDEFYKLALDCGLRGRADFIRDAVRSVK